LNLIKSQTASILELKISPLITRLIIKTKTSHSKAEIFKTIPSETAKTVAPKWIFKFLSFLIALKIPRKAKLIEAKRGYVFLFFIVFIIHHIFIVNNVCFVKGFFYLILIFNMLKLGLSCFISGRIFLNKLVLSDSA